MTAHHFAVTATLEEPVAMSTGVHNRNMAASFPFLTGSALRGAVATRWLRSHGHLQPGVAPAPIADPVLRARFIEVFESGEVRFPFLLPGGRPAPPLSRRHCKTDPSHAQVDLAAPGPAASDQGGGPIVCPVCGNDLDRAKSDASDVRSVVRTRTAIDDTGVVAASMLYSQEELTEGQVFLGDLVSGLAGDDLGAWVPIDEPFPARMGADRSTSGLVTLTIRPQRLVASPLRDRLAAWQARGGGDTVVMTAQSPLILTDAWLRPAQRFTAAVLSESLGLAVQLGAGFTAARTRPAGGWNSAAGLPKPTDVALVEGSVASFTVDAGLGGETVARLERIEESGIGWRRAEGYGAVRFWDERHLLGEAR